jgi:NodT family efflux transporter outer membrane factor (OMF) lipoprotein
MTRKLLSTAALLALSACSFAPHYSRPTLALPANFKEAPGWQPAAPSDDIAKGQWWKLFQDPALDELESRVAVDNQNVAAAAAAYRQARATVREARASLLPTVDLQGGYSRTGTFSKSSSTSIITSTGTTTTGTGSGVGTGSGTTTGTGAGTGSTGTTTGSGTSVLTSSSSGSGRYSVQLGASWEPDVWGRLTSTLREDKALATASAADLANATLSAQGELALDYVQLRGLDAQKAILDDTITAYTKNLQMTTNRYTSGTVARIDVLQAESQLATARANAADLLRQRQAFEHAIAVLVGQNPSSFSIQPVKWAPVVPDVPGVLPADILQRRPDIAGAERRVAAANQQIGVEKAAFFPNISLSGDVGSEASKIGQLFSAASSFWSLGANVAETLLDWGARSARVAEARAAYDQQVATYRQTVLAAFQQVEDELAASQILGIVSQQRVVAARAANQVEAIARNQYLAGQIAYTDVITQQATALSARQTEASSIVDRQVAAITLIQAIGGSWTTPPQP